MANQYFNTGTNHTDYTQGHGLPQSPFQQAHTAATASTPQHLPVYQHSPYAVHPVPPPTHGGYTAPGEHGVIHYHAPLHHASQHRWVNSLDDATMLDKYRDESESAYEMDHHPQPNHQQQQQPGPSQQHMHAMQAQQSAEANMQQPPPITASMSGHTEHMSPAIQPAVVRTGTASHHTILRQVYLFIYTNYVNRRTKRQTSR